MKPIIIISAFNPPDSFKTLLQNIHSITSVPIIIIDDGSIPIILLKNEKIILFRNKTNRGKGFSLLRGFNEAANRGYTHAITMDADSQHDPKLLKYFIKIDENISIVLGNRPFSADMPLHRRASNRLTSLVLSFICNKRIFDSQCGYRRYKLNDVLSHSYVEDGFQFESEVLVNLLCNNFALQHIDIPTIYLQAHSSMNNILDTFKFIRLILRCLIKFKFHISIKNNII